jgi:predicted RND superfamily exporter protein
VRERLHGAIRVLAGGGGRSRSDGRGVGRIRWLVLGLTLLVALALLPGLLRLDIDNSPHIFYVEGSRRAAEYERFLDRFGSDTAVRVVLEGPPLWSAGGLATLGRLDEAAASVPGVTAASSLYSHAQASRREWPPADPESFRRAVGSEGLARDLGWVTGDGEVLTVLVVLTAEDNRSRAETLGRLEEAVERVMERAPDGLSAHLAGGPVLDRALDRSTRDIGERYFPLLVGLAVTLLVLSFRSARAVAVPLVFVAMTELVALGAMGWLGVELNLVLAVLPPLLFVIALATAVHLLVRCRDFAELVSRGADAQPGDEAGGEELPGDGDRGYGAPAEAVERTYRDTGWAVVWTGVSTLVGFASLAVSRVGPVHDLGIWAGVGIAAMILLAFVLYPALLSLMLRPGSVRDGSGHAPGGGSRGDRPFERWFQRSGRRWAEWAARRRLWVLGGASIFTLLALAGLPRVELETNALHYLSPNHPARAGIEELETHGTGTSTVELMLTLPAPESAADGAEAEDGSDAGASTFESLGAFRRLAYLTDRLRREPQVLGAVSAGDFLEDAVERAPGGALFGAVAVRGVAFDQLTGEDRPEVLDRFLARDGRSARVTLFTRTVGTAEMDPLLATVPAVAREILDAKELPGAALPRAQVVATGELPLVLESQHHLLSTLSWSLTITFVVIAAILRGLLPSTRLTLLALVPNLWPVAGVVGFMGWLGMPLDVATVMVASVVLGLAVDDTIHTLGHFRELAPKHGRFEAVAETLELTAPSYVLTGLILGTGFGVCALSDFGPTARFGLLSALAITLAVLGDLFLLPALLGSTPKSVVRRLRRKRS